MKEDTDMTLEDASLDTAPFGVYELGFHIDAGSAEDARRVFEEIRSGIEKADGSVIAEGSPRKVHLAYTISRMETGGRRDFDTAFFSWIGFETDGKARDVIASMLGNDTRIIRFIVLKTTADALQHAEAQLLIEEKALADEDAEDDVSTDLDAVFDEMVAEEVQ